VGPARSPFFAPVPAPTGGIWLGLALAAAATLIAVTGGFAWRVAPITISLRSALTPAALAAVVFAWVIVRRRGQPLTADLRALWLDLHRAGPLLIAAASAVVLAIGVVWGTYAVGGSDSHCYVGQADLFAHGRVSIDEPLGREAPWPDAPLTVAPAGFVPRPGRPGESVPICPPGYPLVMAVMMRAGARGAVFWVVPVLGALLVGAAGSIATLAGGRACGAIAAALTALSPVLLYQVVQPMSDVPAAAWWLLAIAFALRPGAAAAGLAGLASAAAIATRPNMAPLAAVIAASLLWAPRPLGRPIKRAALFCAAAAPGAAAVGLLQWVMLGSPLRSGYGSIALLFSWTRIATNLSDYASWFLATQTALPLAGFAALFLRGAPAVAREPLAIVSRWRLRVLAAVAAVTLGCYLPYLSFTSWWYLRFLLPAIPLVIALFAVVLIAILERVPVALRVPALFPFVMGLLALQLNAARTGAVFQLVQIERRFPVAGTFVATALPPAAVVITLQQSGAVRFYSGRSVLMWQPLRRDWLGRAITFLYGQERPPYLLIESSEEDAFRRRFAGASEFGALDWPPAAQIGPLVRLYDPRDRARYRAGETIPIARIPLSRPESARR
jgi:hypothetical protein